MSEASVAASGGGGISTLAFFAGTIISFCTTPAFVGGMGLAMAALVGVGAFLGSAILGIAGVLIGAAAVGVTFGLVGLAFKKPIIIGLIGAAGGGIVGGLSGNVYGAFKGYDMAKTALVEKVSRTPFNKAAVQSDNTNNYYTAPAAQPVLPSGK